MNFADKIYNKIDTREKRDRLIKMFTIFVVCGGAIVSTILTVAILLK